MTLLEAFAADIVASERGLLVGPELLPERLAHACANVLPVSGASISMVFAPGRRLPLGASDETAAVAERLQFTVGEGPCLEAQATGKPVLADERALAERWPTFHDDLVTRTPLRSIVSLPLGEGLTGIGALDLFFTEPCGLRELGLLDALTVAREVTAGLTAPAGPDDRGQVGPAWLDSPSASRRAQVWQAMGFLNVGLRLQGPDALAVLRGRAYASGRVLEDVAEDLLAGRIVLGDLAPEGTTGP